jgi:hypothetical protein
MKQIKALVLIAVGFFLFALPAWAAQDSTENVLDTSKITCKQLMRGDDAERDVGIAYFHGFMAGKQNIMKLDLTAASALSDKVKDFCLSNPTSTVMDVFTQSSK